MEQPTVSSDSHAGVNAGIQSGGLVNDGASVPMIGEVLHSNLVVGHTSTTAQAQLLLTALHNVVIPLVQAAVPNFKGKLCLLFM